MQTKRHLWIFAVLVLISIGSRALAIVPTAKSKPVIKAAHLVNPPSHVVQLLLNSYHGDTDMEALSAALHPSTVAAVVTSSKTVTAVPALSPKPLLAGRTTP